MYNWLTDEKELLKDKEKYAIWKIEQVVNFGRRKNKRKRFEKVLETSHA